MFRMFCSNILKSLFFLQTKTRNELEQARTIYIQLAVTSINQLEQAGNRWSYQRLALERVRVDTCSGS